MYRPPNIVRVFKSRILRWAGHVARMEEGRMPRRRWEDNIRMDLEEIGINAVIGLIRLRIGIIGEPL